MAAEKPNTGTAPEAPSSIQDPAWVDVAMQNRGVRVAPAPPRAKTASKPPQATVAPAPKAIKNSPRKSAARRQGMSLLNQMLVAGLCLGLFAISLPTALLLTFTLLPALCACLVAHRQGYYMAISMGALSFAGAWPFLLKLWLSGHSIVNVMQMILTPKTWLIIYGAAALGWAMCQWFPVFVSSFMSMFSAHRVKDLQQKQKKLIDEWGEEVANPQAAPDR